MGLEKIAPCPLTVSTVYRELKPLKRRAAGAVGLIRFLSAQPRAKAMGWQIVFSSVY
ncbi:hypothetical protein [Spirosoma areae]